MAVSPDPKHLISSLVSPQTMQLALRGRDRDSVLAELTALVPELSTRPDDQQRLLRALVERETMHSTGLGDGIALPHTRDTLGGLVTSPCIVIGRHPTGIPFNAIDGHPVRVFFLLVTTSVTQHLQILARISRLLRDPRLRTALATSPQPAAILDTLRTVEASG